jgi:hypothetical protein
MSYSGISECALIGEVVPGWKLVQFEKTNRDAKRGDFGLICDNELEFIWTDAPMEEPCVNHPSAELAHLSDADHDELWHFSDVVDRLERNFVCTPDVGHKLFVACISAGFDPKKNGYTIIHWLFDRMGKMYLDWKETYIGNIYS